LKEIYKLTREEYERLLRFFPNLKGDTFEDEDPTRVCPKARMCLVTIHRVEFTETGCIFQCEVTLGGEGEKIVNAFATGLANEKVKSYVLPIPPYALSTLFDIMLDGSVVDLKLLTHMHVPYGGDSVMYSFLKNLGLYADAMRGAQSVLEHNVTELRHMAEQIGDPQILKKLDELEDEAIQVIKKMNTLLPLMTELYSNIQKKAFENYNQDKDDRIDPA